MASIEKRGQSYRIIFRFGGIKYTRSLDTRDERAANSALARVEDTLHRLELGALAVPSGTDLVEFLLSDGRPKPLTAPATNDNPVELATATLTLARLFTEYLAKLPDGSLEEITISTMKIHQKQLEKHFGKGLLIDGLQPKLSLPVEILHP